MTTEIVTSRQMKPEKSTSSYGNWSVGYWFTAKDYKGRQYNQHSYKYFWKKSEAIKWINSFN